MGRPVLRAVLTTKKPLLQTNLCTQHNYTYLYTISIFFVRKIFTVEVEPCMVERF